jgi:ubiquinone/menaquinone biosynthesis C-methylase UbiE
MTQPPPREEWDQIAAFYDATRAFPGDGERSVPRAAANLLRSRGASDVLEIGCGTGRFTVPLAAEGLRVVGVDRSGPMMAKLREKKGACLVRLVAADALALPFSRVFDAVVFSHVLHLLPSMRTLADGLRDVLVPGGIIVDADTTHAVRHVTEPVLARFFPKVDPMFSPWPTGERSRSRDLMDELAGHLGAAPAEVVPCATWTTATTPRAVLAALRSRVWSSVRRFPEAAVFAAVDATEREMLADGVDLDATGHDAEGVRFLVLTLPGDAR